MTRRLLLVGLVLLASISGRCNANSRQLLDQAEARWREGNYEDAIRLNTILYERDPQGRYAAQALLNRGNIYYLNLRQLNKAIQTYQKLVSELSGRPEELKAREQLAGIYANEIGDLTQAVFEYEKILAAGDPENTAEIRFQMANAFFKLNDFDRALRELRRVEELRSSGHLWEQAQLKIGNVYQIRRQYEDAIEPFQKVSESPCLECRRRALLHLMETYESVYDFDRAIDAVQKLDRIPENELRIRHEVARLAEKRKRVDSGAALLWEKQRIH